MSSSRQCATFGGDDWEPAHWEQRLLDAEFRKKQSHLHDTQNGHPTSKREDLNHKKKLQEQPMEEENEVPEKNYFRKKEKVSVGKKQ